MMLLGRSKLGRLTKDVVDNGSRERMTAPPELLEKILERNMRVYGDPLGPTVERLRNQGKTWEQIIESASRPGGKDIF